MYLIVGGDSAIGKELSLYLKTKKIPHCSSTRQFKLISEYRPYIDLAKNEWKDLDKYNFDAVVFCAAITKLSVCEEFPNLTHEVNVRGTSALAKYLIERGSRILLLSTDKVFDGSKMKYFSKDQVKPICEYGRQKVEVEKIILGTPNSVILRLTKVIHPGLPLLIKWSNELQMGRAIYAYTDMYLSPISIEKVIKKIEQLLSKKMTGIIHLYGDEEVSYYNFAKQYFRNSYDVDSLILEQKSRI